MKIQDKGNTLRKGRMQHSGQKLRQIMLRGFLAVLFVIIAGGALIKIENSQIKCTVYEINSEKKVRAKIALLTDLHNGEFGEGNFKLLDKISDRSPDIICMAGDMLNANEETRDVLLELIEEAGKIAPVYFSYGNHEKEYESNFGISLRPLLEKAGAHVLEEEYADIELGGQQIRIGGLYGYAMPTQKGFDGKEQEFLEEFQNTDRYKLLLCHMPAAWIQWGSLEYWNVDLVLAGHTHGGQIKLPFIGGITAPDQGWFPDVTNGFISRNGRNLIISAGLGTNGWVPRVNNPPELVIIEIGKNNS